MALQAVWGLQYPTPLAVTPDIISAQRNFASAAGQIDGETRHGQAAQPDSQFFGELPGFTQRQTEMGGALGQIALEQIVRFYSGGNQGSRQLFQYPNLIIDSFQENRLVYHRNKVLPLY